MERNNLTQLNMENKMTKQMYLLGDECFENYSQEELDSWQGYIYSITYATWSEEDIEAGETDDRGFEAEDIHCETLNECMLDDFAGGSPSSYPIKKYTQYDWITMTEENYRTGELTNRSLHIKRADGQEFCEEESEYIKKKLEL